ncbi:MAG TPA: hypothetical protein VF519_05365 [Mycobacteriales bacterium]|jgi:hypothetical protein
MRLAVAALLVAACAGCGGGSKPTFNALPTAPATAPATPVYVAKTGRSDVHIGGEIVIDTTQDFQCSYAPDDFFVRGQLGEYDGVPVYFSLNVEFYKGPGRYPRKTQLLLRKVSDDSSVYSSWYQGFATATILPKGKGADLEAATLQPEAGTESTAPVTIRGHFDCVGRPSPGPG